MNKESQAQESGSFYLPDYLGARVKINLKSSLSDTLAGKVVAATEGGLILKHKGSSRAGLIELEEIKSIEFDTELLPVKPIELVWPKVSHVRKHLAVHHGFTLSAVNSMASERAKLEHDAIHAGPGAHDLGHVHRGQEHLRNRGDSE